jgi:hypothetical protein
MPRERPAALTRGVAHTVHRCSAMAMNRHVHHRRDGIAVICTGAWCTPSRARQIAWRVLLVAGPVAVLATSGALGLRSSSSFALALLALAALLAWWATRAPGAARIERDVRAKCDRAERHATAS